MKISGIKIATCNSGIKYQNRDDLMLAIFDKEIAIAGVFTKNAIKGAPVYNALKNLSQNKTARALIVNAGNANVFNGEKGDEIVQKTASVISQELQCHENQVYISSTGVIGELFDYNLITDKVPALVQNANYHTNNVQKAAAAIMTTDLAPKVATATCQIDDKEITVQGFAKGSGMIAPNMATMLAYIFTDTNIEATILQEVLVEINEETFNSITVDSDTSTSDTALLFATGDAGNKIIDKPNDEGLLSLKKALNEVMLDLAKKIVRDGEGAKKLIEINVTGASSKEQAKATAFAVGYSPLVKTAMAAADPNWGRIAAAIGKACPEVNQDELRIDLGTYQIIENGALHHSYNEDLVHQYLKNEEVAININLGLNKNETLKFKKTIYTCDFNEEYVKINKEYRT